MTDLCINNFCLNRQGFVSNKDELSIFVLYTKAVILCISETRIDHNTVKGEIMFRDYNMECSCTPNRRIEHKTSKLVILVLM